MATTNNIARETMGTKRGAALASETGGSESTITLTKGELMGLLGTSYGLSGKEEPISAVVIACSGMEAVARALEVARHAASTDESEDLDMVLYELANRLHALAEVTWSIARQPMKAANVAAENAADNGGAS